MRPSTGIAQFVMLSVCAALLATTVGACNPSPNNMRIANGVGIRDYFTVRIEPSGEVTVRDRAPTPQPREAITGDDYFGMKLEHIYAADALGREVGNMAIIAELEGIVPDGVRCDVYSAEQLEEEVGFSAAQSQSSNAVASQNCAYKTIVQINPIFRDSHATFDSAFITPPFRSNTQPLKLHFIIAQLNDVSLARRIMGWIQDKLSALSQADIVNMSSWQNELVSVGFEGVNYLLDYLARPTYVLEFQTDFVPVETVEGAQPQSLLMGGNFVVVGMAPAPGIPQGALRATDELIYSSGRLYDAETREEYRASPYIVFNVVRFSRYPNELPVQLSRVSRGVERGMDAEEIGQQAENMVLDLQDARVLNETEGALLKDLFEWYAEASVVAARLDDHEYDQSDIPLAWSDARASSVAGVLPIMDLTEAAQLLQTLEGRIYANYGQTPGMRQDECVAIRSLTQDIVDAYQDKVPDVQRGFETLQIRRAQLQRQDGRDDNAEMEYQALVAIENEVLSLMQRLPAELPEPVCPALRQAYIPEAQ